MFKRLNHKGNKVFPIIIIGLSISHSRSSLIYITEIYLTFLLTTNYNNNDIMRRLLKFTNYAAQLMALIDIGKTIKRWATKSNTTSDGQTKDKT